MEPTLFLNISVGLIALGVWVGVGFLIYALLQVRRAAAAVEVLAYDLGDSVSNVRRATEGLVRVSDFVRSGWMRAFESAFGAAASLWTGRRARTGAAAHDDH